MADLESGARPREVEMESAVANGVSAHDVTGHRNKKYDLSIHSLSYKVVSKSKEGTTERLLLNNVSAIARHGQMTAVMGPSGAGKSTFLDAVAGRISPESLEGGILVNGKPMEAGFKRLSGYVMQDDQLFPMLSVRETLMFSARLRLPDTMTTAEKKQRVEEMITELGLTNAADTKIGNEEVRGVSGGEKRRVSIGVDLIHDPPVLFLDEPTSGLDSTSALNVVQILRNIAQGKNRTIVLTIHQPSFRILDLIDNFLILARGNPVYHGSYPGLAPYLREFGRHVPNHVNVLEYTLDTIEELQESKEGIQPLVDFAQAKYEDHGKLAQLQSNMSVVGEKPKFATSFFSELLVLSDRCLRNTLRTPELFMARIGLMCSTSFVLGSLFFSIGFTPFGIQARASFIAFALALLYFTSTEALPIFLAEKQIFIRETSRGAYRTSAYAISSAIVFLPFFWVLALIFSCISYWMIGMAAEAGSFFFFVFTLFLVLSVANSFVVFWSALVPNFITGNTIITAVIAYFFLFCGFFIPRNDIPDYWIWFHYLSTFKYPLEMLLDNEFMSPGVRDQCFDGLPGPNCRSTARQVLASFDMGGVHKWNNAAIMICMFLFYRVCFYVALRWVSARTRK